MALGRWWNPFARKSRPGDGPEGAASLPPTAPVPMAHKPIAAPAPALAPAAAMGTPAPAAEAVAPIDVPLTDPQRIAFFRWIVGVPAIAGTSGLPDLVV